MQPLPLAALRAFVEVGRRGGIKDAAAILGVTPGAVSQQVRALELRLGVSLLERLHRAVRMTDEGERLFAGLDPAFSQIERAVEPYGGCTGRANLLTITTTPSLAGTWLAARLGRFAALHPDIEVRLLSSVALADLDRGEADLAIRHGSGAYPGLSSDRLFAPRLIVVGSPALLEGRPPICGIADCLGFPLLQDRGRRDWGRFAIDMGGSMDANWSSGSVFADDALLIRAAIAGQGLAVVRDIYARDDLAAGRLEQAMPDAMPTGEAYHLVARRERLREPKLRAFRDWLIDVASARGIG